ncbi:MAG: SGNH/GDSL hydrolase family protein [Pirellulales bacterium]|nr:SGNH/GDSL hydrolase family protein [Pirellulales bacterium]
MPARANLSGAAPLLTRRDAFATGAAIVGAAGAWGPALPASAAQSLGESLVRPGDVVLFQGDSITDAGRDRTRNEPNDQRAAGAGYAWLAAAHLLINRPDDRLAIHNRGISGNKVHQLAERWQTDCLDLKPDVLSILIGVNDVWHRVNGQYDGTLATYRDDYRALLERTKKALPSVKLVICEPFVLRCGSVTDAFFPAIDEFRGVAKEICDEFDGRFVAFQTLLDAAAELAAKEFWLRDGVHPTDHGAALMAGAWLQATGTA